MGRPEACSVAGRSAIWLETVPLSFRHCRVTDGMIWTGLGSPYSMFALVLRATTLLPTAGAATKPCASALTRYSIFFGVAVGRVGGEARMKSERIERERVPKGVRHPWANKRNAKARRLGVW